MPKASSGENEFALGNFILLAGGGLLFLYRGGLVIRVTPFRKIEIVHNPALERLSLLEVREMSLRDVLRGSGVVLNENVDKQASGSLDQLAQMSFVQVVDRHLKRKVALCFDEFGLPMNDSEEKFVEDPHNRQQFLQDHQQLKKFLKSARETLLNEKLFVDFYGNYLHTLFDDEGRAIYDQEVWMLQDANKTLYVRNNTAHLIDAQSLSYSSFEGIFENKQSKTVQQVFASLSHANSVRQYLLNGIKYQGSLSAWRQTQGNLYFSFSNHIRIAQPYLAGASYATRVTYQNNDFFEGTLERGMFQGWGVYGNKTAKIFEGNYRDDVFTEGTIYYAADQPSTHYHGQVALLGANYIR